jgi:hypothetical protein
MPTLPFGICPGLYCTDLTEFKQSVLYQRIKDAGEDVFDTPPHDPPRESIGFRDKKLDANDNSGDNLSGIRGGNKKNPKNNDIEDEDDKSLLGDHEPVFGFERKGTMNTISPPHKVDKTPISRLQTVPAILVKSASNLDKDSSKKPEPAEKSTPVSNQPSASPDPPKVGRFLNKASEGAISFKVESPGTNKKDSNSPRDQSPSISNTLTPDINKTIQSVRSNRDLLPSKSGKTLEKLIEEKNEGLRKSRRDIEIIQLIQSEIERACPPPSRPNHAQKVAQELKMADQPKESQPANSSKRPSAYFGNSPQPILAQSIPSLPESKVTSPPQGAFIRDSNGVKFPSEFTDSSIL